MDALERYLAQCAVIDRLSKSDLVLILAELHGILEAATGDDYCAVAKVREVFESRLQLRFVEGV